MGGSYLSHVLANLTSLAFYGLFGLWMHTRPWSTMYVVWWVVATDMLVLFCLKHLRLQRYAEVLFFTAFK